MKNTFVALLTIILLVASSVTFAAEECPLCKAAQSDDVSKVKILLDNGADVNGEDQRGNTALIWTAVNSHGEVTKLLLAHGANVDYETKEGWTALINAAEFGLNNVVKVLLDNEANVNYENNEGNTALILATKKRQDNVMKVLLACGANPDITNHAGETAWDLAPNNNRRIFNILEKHHKDVEQGKQFPPCDKTAAI